LNEKLARDTVKDVGGLRFKDVLIPRVGFEFRATRNLSLLGGVSYEESPLETTESLDVNYVDNNRYVVGLGLSYLIEQAMIFSQPIRLDVGYQYHILEDRDFRLSTTRNVGNQPGQDPATGAPCAAGTRCEDVTAGGNVHVFNASINLKF
ncbi:hypothetical protein ABTG99_19710, partial [Acinetobacter baumannii]